METTIVILAVAVLALSCVSLVTLRRLRFLENLARTAAERLGEPHYE